MGNRQKPLSQIWPDRLILWIITYYFLKLKYYGVRGAALQIIRSYLNSRDQQAWLNGSVSDMTRIWRGVPQRFILGPTLFVIFINDLLNSITHSKCILYADDHTLPRTRSLNDGDLLEKVDWSGQHAKAWFWLEQQQLEFKCWKKQNI